MNLHSITSGVELISPVDFQSNQLSTLCVSGHREKSIIPYENNPIYQNVTIATVRMLLAYYIDSAIKNGYDTFLSGMAVGVDLWAAQHILNRRLEGFDIKLIGVIPYINHAKGFPKRYLDLLYKCEKLADKMIVINPNPDINYSSYPVHENQSKTLYRDRNYFMVDNSSAIIAFLNKSSYISGTAQTVNYANKKNLSNCQFDLEKVYGIISEANCDIRKIQSLINSQ